MHVPTTLVKMTFLKHMVTVSTKKHLVVDAADEHVSAVGDSIDINRGIADSEWRENMFKFRSALTGSHRKSKPWTLTVLTVAMRKRILYQFPNFMMYLR